MSFIDPALLFLLIAIVPVAGYFSFKRLVRRVAAGEPLNRNQFYQGTILTQWSLFAITLAAWLFQDRSLETLGFGLRMHLGFYFGVILTAAGIVALLYQLRQIKGAPQKELQKVRDQLGVLAFILPRNGNELGRFYALSLTAGVVEETLWRGFIIWYLSLFMPIWAAAVISVVGFAVAHAYQGIENLPKIGLVGSAFTVLFLLSGSLFLPIVMHAAVDILQGRAAYELMRRSNDANTADTDADAVSVT